jgi:acetyl esterase/lipase
MASTPSAGLVAASRLEPQTQAFLDGLARLGGPPIYTLSPADARNVYRNAQNVDVPKPPADIVDRSVPGGPGGDVSVRVFRPRGADGPLPAVVYVHGGGWVLGDKDTHDRLARELAVGANAAVVFVNYTPSPEAKFSVAIEQSYAVARWVADRGREADLDGSRLAVAGDSAGANIAAALTLAAKERGGPRFALQLLFFPVTDAGFDTGSYNQFADGYRLTKATMKWFWDQYLPDLAMRAQPLASPLRAGPEQLKGLPPALVITAENDVLRDEGEAYAHRLIQSGVPVTAARYLGSIHDFVLLNAITATPAPRAAIAQAVAAIRAALVP